MFRLEKIVVTPAWAELLRANQLDSMASVYACATGDVVTQSGTTEVRRVTLTAGPAQRVVYIKKYWANNFGQLWSGALRGTLLGRSKAKREFENLARLIRWKLDAPAPIAFGEERIFGWMTRSFLISEEIPSPLTLDIFIRDFLPRLPAEQRRKRAVELLERLAATTRQLHEHHFVHHDYFWRNIILSGETLDRFFLIDAHKGRTWRRWSAQRCQAKDLAALDSAAPAFFSQTDRLSFFLAYTRSRALTPENKKLLRTVLSLAEPMRQRQIQRVKGSRRTH